MEKKETAPPATAAEAPGTLAPKPILELTPAPFFADHDTLWNELDIAMRETAARAYEIFLARNGMFGDQFDDWLKAENELLRPAPVEILQKDDKVIVSAAVPGFKPEDIEMSVKDDQLLLKGSLEADEEHTEGNVVLKEWKSDRFFRRITLPFAVDEKNVVNEMKDGLLKLTLTKAAGEAALSAKA